MIGDAKIVQAFGGIQAIPTRLSSTAAGRSSQGMSALRRRKLLKSKSSPSFERDIMFRLHPLDHRRSLPFSPSGWSPVSLKGRRAARMFINIVFND